MKCMTCSGSPPLIKGVLLDRDNRVVSEFPIRLVMPTPPRPAPKGRDEHHEYREEDLSNDVKPSMRYWRRELALASVTGAIKLDIALVKAPEHHRAWKGRWPAW